jgi:biopolymer transport protein ExbB
LFFAVSLFTFAQSVAVGGDAAQAAGAAEAAVGGSVVPGAVAVEISTLDLILKGGWIMLPIFILLAMAVYLFVYKYLSIKKAGRVDRLLMDNVVSNLRNGDVKSALQLSQGHPTLLARILERGMLRIGSPIPEIESGMESAARAATTSLEKNMNILASVATMAPMFGFFGTVLGMITVFTDIAMSHDQLSISTIAEGMYVKMVSSAAGIIVGILAHMFHTYLNSMIDGALSRLEDASSELLDILYKP